MLIGVIADDFTGASDIANTLSKGLCTSGGLKTEQFSGVPKAPAGIDVEAGVIALKSRTAPVTNAVRDSLAALHWLREQGCEQIVFKVCSTFDSTPHGNIGPVAEALADALSTNTVIACPAFPGAGRTVYQGHLFVFDKLLNESGMEAHPLTPMTDPDIRRWLQDQTTRVVGHFPLADLRSGEAKSRARLIELRENASGFVVADAVADEDLMVLGALLDNAPLLIGGSGIALALPRNFIKSGRAVGSKPGSDRISGPGAILAGSCSGATRGQIEHYAKSHPTHAINVAKVMSGDITSQSLVTYIEGHRSAAPLVYSSSNPEDVAALQTQFGRENVAAQLEHLFADTAQKLVDLGYRRIVVAGGETSGAVAQAVTAHLGVDAMRVGAEIDQGVPILTVQASEPVALALKSGNFGSQDFFDKALKMMGPP